MSFKRSTALLTLYSLSCQSCRSCLKICFKPSLPTVFCPLSSRPPPSSTLCPLSSVICPLSSLLRPLNEVLLICRLPGKPKSSYFASLAPLRFTKPYPLRFAPRSIFSIPSSLPIFVITYSFMFGTQIYADYYFLFLNILRISVHLRPIKFRSCFLK